MVAALVDNGSLEAAAHRNLRSVASALAARAGLEVQAVSWRHSDRVPAADLDGVPAWTVAPWVRAQLARGEREFLFLPFFICPQGAIGTSLHRDLAALQRSTGGFDYAFASGLAQDPSGAARPGPLAEIVALRVRETLAEGEKPSVIVVDHGGPSREAAALRDAVAAEARRRLGPSVRALAAASMESPDGPGFAHNRPLLADQLRAPGFDRGEVVIAPLFLSPGRHAGPAGDLARIAATAPARVRFADLVGTHPAAVEILSRALQAALAPAA